MDLYAENILEHYRHPHRKGKLANFTVERTERNASCGDAFTVQMLLENGRVADIQWDGNGCAISQASMSLLSDEIVGKTTQEIDAMTPKALLDLLGIDIGPSRIKCAALSLLAVKNTVATAEGKATVGWPDIL